MPSSWYDVHFGYQLSGVGGVSATSAKANAPMLIPSTTLVLALTRWGSKRRESRSVRAFVAGMAPITIGLLLSTGTVLALPLVRQPGAWLLIAATVALSLRTRLSPMWLIMGGAAVGASGWI